MGEKLVALAVQVHPHVRITKQGRRVLVRGYERKGEAARHEDAHRMARAQIARAAAQEPAMTKMLSELADDQGARMVGLEFRLKSPESLTRKIVAEQGGRSLAETARSMSDVLRYTMVQDGHAYADTVRSTLQRLEERGHKLRTKNYWRQGDPYQGLNVAVTSPTGLTWELQFHTPESVQIKEEVHKMYEQYRTSSDNAERRKLYEAMVKISAKAPAPPGIEGLPTEKFQPYEDLPAITKP